GRRVQGRRSEGRPVAKYCGGRRSSGPCGPRATAHDGPNAGPPRVPRRVAQGSTASGNAGRPSVTRRTRRLCRLHSPSASPRAFAFPPRLLRQVGVQLRPLNQDTYGQNTADLHGDFGRADTPTEQVRHVNMSEDAPLELKNPIIALGNQVVFGVLLPALAIQRITQNEELSNAPDDCLENFIAE